jgi:hypothetical protein
MSDRHPKSGDEVGDRTIICVKGETIVFGQRDGDLRNCGAYVTDFEEWYEYKFSLPPSNVGTAGERS